jgi:hypothetical protein
VKYKKTILALFVIAVLASVLAMPDVRWTLVGWYRGEPSWQRRPLSWWRHEAAALHVSSVYNTREGKTLREVSCWLYEPTGEDSPPAAIDAHGLQILLALLSDPEPKVRYWAAERLGWAGADASPALPKLRQAASDAVVVIDGVTAGSAAAEAVEKIERAQKDEAGRGKW